SVTFAGDGVSPSGCSLLWLLWETCPAWCGVESKVTRASPWMRCCFPPRRWHLRSAKANRRANHPREIDAGAGPRTFMNIWILNHHADAPDRQATRSYDLSRQLVGRGHRVTIFAAGFSHYSFSEERIRDGEAWREETWNGVRFLWLKTPP